MAERGDVREAAELLEQALVEDPQDEAALVALCELGDKLPKGFGLSEKLGRALAGLAPPAADAGVAPPPRASCGSGTASWPARRRPSPPSRRSSRSSRSTPSSSRRARRWARSTSDRPGYEDAAIENHRRLLALDVTRARFAARAGRRLRAPRPGRSRALLPRGAVGAGPRDQGRGSVPGGAPAPGAEARRPLRRRRRRSGPRATTWRCPRRR